MKWWGVLLVAGILCIIAGVYGIAQVSDTGFSGGDFDAMMRMISGAGAPSYNSLPALMARYRIWLLIGGVILAGAGVVVRKRDSKGA